MTAPAKDPWIAHYRPNRAARMRLFCFPYAGGSAMTYRGWSDELPPEVEVLPVELPGRASRFREPAFRRVTDLVAAAADALAHRLDRPYAFFGHSMGSLIAFELARELRRRGIDTPRVLFASARRAPDVPFQEKAVHALPEDEFIVRLRELNGTPEEVLEHPELMEMMLPLLRADFEINETYEYRPEEPLAASIHALGGLADSGVSREHLEAWRPHGRGEFSLRMFPGDHFYLNSDRRMLFSVLATVLHGAF